MAYKAASPPPPPSASSSPLLILVGAFVAWKSFILLLSYGSALVGPDYDTSTSLLFSLLGAPSSSSSTTTLAGRLTRWDAIYFVHGARVGHVYEQQWAFSPVLSLLLRWLSRTALPHGDQPEALAGIALAHASHLAAALTLHRLTALLQGGGDARMPLLAALLCVLAPAGVFLSAPYAEAPFSALSFAGVWVLAAGYRHRRGSARRWRPRPRDSAASWSLSGAWCRSMPRTRSTATAAPRGRRGATGRNVGFLRYWTPSQIPLFLLAAPVLSLLLVSGWQVLRRPAAAAGMSPSIQADHRTLLRALAASQAIVALLALTSYHVQVISRLASGYAVWYWWIAACLVDAERRATGRAAVVFMVMYAGIQAVLFSTFLPPA
ncbi:DUF409 domain protein [Cordyceps fumosorosea ARSEF 2679]|uniref:GPI mannosyltransferase 2 n=1 Tax=Cordyceps fumosorosea (strain ARSEF 2679) TaxID=1081104 RepID=A0A167VSA2_CORFA|nr:DUF409 domain protein [Cordyceps fumosorosea ARSEF 2679]OAA62929.1 DUF409 domain protein [Cordyceps fumosorosea ARSEF 2679]